MKIYQYKNYDDYVNAQTVANTRKIKYVWVQKDTINLIKNYIPIASKILCHGTRNGREQEYFIEEYDNVYVIGSEISHTAEEFPNTVQHDFNLPRDEWINTFDVVYSNAIDHSYDPKTALQVWKNQLCKTGKLCLEVALNPNDNKSRPSDPVEFEDENEIVNLLINTGFNILHKLECDSSSDFKKNASTLFICSIRED